MENKNTIISMTGFGHSSGEVNSISLDVVTKSVNSRFLDLQLRFPSIYVNLEQPVTEYIHKNFSRGRIEVNIQRKNLSSQSNKTKSFDDESFADSFTKFKELGRKVGVRVSSKTLFSNLISRFDYFISNNQSETASQNELDKVNELIENSLTNLKNSRVKEGAALTTVINSQIGTVKKHFETIQVLVPEAFNNNTLKLKSRLESLNPEIDQQRVAQEFAILADRLDVSEELARFKIHLDSFEKGVITGGGKKGEFMLQELGREINTLGNKAQSAEVSQHVIEIKTLLERVREQIMNIE